jgi:hypothetical protein
MLPNTSIGYAIVPSATIFSHLVSLESTINVASLAIVIPAFSNQTPSACLSNTLLSLSCLCISVRVADLHLIVIILLDES